MPTKIDPATGREIDTATGRPIVNAPSRPDASVRTAAPAPTGTPLPNAAQQAAQRALVPGQVGYDARLDPRLPKQPRRERVRNITDASISQELDGRKFTLDPGQVGWVDATQRKSLGDKVANVSIGETTDTFTPPILHIVRIVATKAITVDGWEYPEGECFETDNVTADGLIKSGDAVAQAA